MVVVECPTSCKRDTELSGTGISGGRGIWPGGMSGSHPFQPHPLPSPVIRCRRRFWHATVRLRSAIRRHHPPQRAVLNQICCFGEHKVVLFQILLDSAEPLDAGTTWSSSPVRRGGGKANRILLASALSSMRIICPNRVSRCNWIIAVSLGWFVTNKLESRHREVT